jgi:two-component sensor histidine kinase
MKNYPKPDFILRVRPWSLAAVGSAFLAVGISSLLRAAIAEFGGTLYFAPYFPAVLVVSVFAGVPAAVLTVALTTVLVWWAYLSPSFEFGPLSRNDLANIATFWISAALIVTLAHIYRKTLTSALKGEEARELLIRELQHRAGNTLAVMQAIINGTISVDRDRLRVIDRIQALARANELVTKAAIGPGLALEQLIKSEAESYASPDRLHVEGPLVNLDGETARSLALVLHELMTNAAKYGALSNGHGTLQIGWSCKDGQCRLHWTETDGPAVITPTRLGFGTRMMKASLAQIAATIEPEFCSDGYSCLLTFSISNGLWKDPASPKL